MMSPAATMVDASSRSFIKSPLSVVRRHNDRALFAGLTDVTTHRSLRNRHPSASNEQQAFAGKRYSSSKPALPSSSANASISGQTFTAQPPTWGWRDWFQNAATAPIAAEGSALDRAEEP